MYRFFVPYLVVLLGEESHFQCISALLCYPIVYCLWVGVSPMALSIWEPPSKSRGLGGGLYRQSLCCCSLPSI